GVLSNQTDLMTALNGKANLVHTHDASDITSGVLNIARIPTGTTSSTVALGNHTHSFAQITNKPTTISGYGIADAYTKSEVNSGFVPYTGANKTIDFNNQRVISQKGIRVDNGHSDIFAVKSMLNPGQKKVIIKIENPAQTGVLMGDYNVHIFRYAGRSYIFNIASYKYNSLFNQPTVSLTHGNSEDIVAVRFLHDGNGILYIEFEFTGTATYVSVMLTNGNFMGNYPDHNTEWTITNDILFDTSSLILQASRLPSQFTRDSYLWNKGNFTQTNV